MRFLPSGRCPSSGTSPPRPRAGRSRVCARTGRAARRRRGAAGDRRDAPRRRRRSGRAPAPGRGPRAGRRNGARRRGRGIRAAAPIRHSRRSCRDRARCPRRRRRNRRRDPPSGCRWRRPPAGRRRRRRPAPRRGCRDSSAGSDARRRGRRRRDRASRETPRCAASPPRRARRRAPRRSRSRPASADLPDPVREVVVSHHPGDLAVLQGEEGAGWQTVGLAVCLGQACVGGEIGAVDDVLGGSAGAALGLEDHHVGEVLVVAVGHVGAEFGKLDLAAAHLALVDVMRHLGVEAGEHRLGVLGVERVEIAADRVSRAHLSPHRFLSLS